MFGNHLWNLAWGPNMSSLRDLTRDKAKRPDMSGLGAEHVQDHSLEPR
jgi:hypothetical protein